MPVGLFAQERLEGIVYDKESKVRLGEVLIYNPKTKDRIFNNHKGEFRIDAKEADTLIFLKQGFFSDTLVVTNKKAMIVSMLRDFTQIEPVDIFARRSPEELLEAVKKDYSKAYKLADPGDIFSVGATGAGLSIGSIYNMLSKEGRNARRFTDYMQTLYKENVIDYRFTPDLVRNLVGLEGDRLRNFMIRFRPTYEFVMAASHYELTQYIKSKYNLFMIAPDLRPLPELPLLELNINDEK